MGGQPLNKNKSAFSLAEAMVMLVVISILLAVSAPLIAKKANADQRRLVVQGQNASVVTAMGGNQNFGIGLNQPTAKLHVTANRLLALFQSTRAGNDETAHTTPIFEIMPNSNTPNPEAANNFVPNPNGFKVYADGTTNIQACVPDYDNAVPISTHDASCDLYDNGATIIQCYRMDATPDNGYIMASRTIFVKGSFSVYPTMIPYTISVAGNTATVKQYEYYGHIIAPVHANQTVFIFRDKTGENPTCDYHCTQDEIYNNNNYLPKFVPCMQPRN